MDILIKATDEEKKAVLQAIQKLGDIKHIKHMSHSMIAESAGILATKVRLVLADLITDGIINQYPVTQNKKLQRYYYTINKENE